MSLNRNVQRRTLIATAIGLATTGFGQSPQAAAGMGTGQSAPAAPAAPENERRAELVPGKHTLYQRVLTRPGAVPRAVGSNAGAAEALPPLTPLFVFAHQQAQGQGWVEVGTLWHGATLGWLPEHEMIPWATTMIAAFLNPVNRTRVLFMRDRDMLKGLLAGGGPEDEARRLLAIADHPPVPDDFPALATEPPQFVDINKQFYLLPILQAERLELQDGREYEMCEVVSVPFTHSPPPSAQTFTMGIVFVVDATQSMDPYLDRVRAALNEVVRAAAADTTQKTKFALVGFRNNLTAQPRLQWLTKIFARFADNHDPDQFASLIGQVHAADADSLSWDEDSFAGLETAMTQLDWTGIDGKAIVLISDAASRAPNDPFSSTHKTDADIGQQARELGMSVLMLHLMTPAGGFDHDHAAQQYRTLTASAAPDLRPAYFPVDNGSDAELERQVRALIATLRSVSQQQAAHRAPASGQPGNDQNDVAARAATLGLAMRLAWLGRQSQATAPDVLRAWASDGYRGHNPAENLEVRVLLTRNQLNDLAQALRYIVDEGRRNSLDPPALFTRLQTVAAHLLVDPARLHEQRLESLGDLMGEYLDGLPYRSEVAGMTYNDWKFMSADAQNQFLDKLESHLRTYHTYNETPDLWHSFDGGRDPGEAVYPVPLSALP